MYLSTRISTAVRLETHLLNCSRYTDAAVALGPERVKRAAENQNSAPTADGNVAVTPEHSNELICWQQNHIS